MRAIVRMVRIWPMFGSMAVMETYLLQVAFWLTLGLGGLALALTLSGLCSVLSYLVEQRAMEIGVRGFQAMDPVVRTPSSRGHR